MNRHQEWLKKPYQLDQEEVSGMIPIKSGLGVDYISSEDAENEIAMNEARIDALEQELASLLNGSSESEEPSLIQKYQRQIQELEEANDMLKSALRGDFELNEYAEQIQPEKFEPKKKEDEYIIDEDDLEPDPNEPVPIKRVALKPNSPDAKPYRFAENEESLKTKLLRAQDPVEKEILQKQLDGLLRKKGDSLKDLLSSKSPIKEKKYRGNQEPDIHMQYELQLFIDNDGNLHGQMKSPIYKNLYNKLKKDKFDYALGVKAFKNLVEEGNRRYKKEYNSDISLSPIDKDALAKTMLDEFLDQYENGELNYIEKQRKFAEDREIPEHLQYKPSVSYNPFKDGFTDAIDPKTGKKWTTKDISYLLSDLNETYVKAINESLDEDDNQKAQKIAFFLRKYLDKIGFPYAVAVKRFPVIREAYYQFAEDSVHQMARQKKVDYLLGLIDSKLKEKSLPKEKKSELTSKKKELEAIKAKMTEFNEDCYAELPRRFSDKSKNEQSHIKNNLNGLKMALETWLSDESLSEIKKAMDSVDEMGVTPIELARHIPETKHLFKLKHGYFAEFAEKGNKSPSARLKAKLSKEQLKDLNVRLYMLEDAITRWRKDKGINRLLQDLFTSGLKSNEISSLVPNAKGYLEINKIA